MVSQYRDYRKYRQCNNVSKGNVNFHKIGQYSQKEVQT